MKAKQLTVQQYLDEQSKRFEFANNMSICEGSESYKPKYTLTHIVDESANALDFINNVDKHIIAKLHFNIDATDKANLLAWFNAKSNKVVDESQVESVDEATLTQLAKSQQVEMQSFNNCFVFESAYIDNISNFVKNSVVLGNNAADAIRWSVTDTGKTFKCALSKSFVNQ